MNNGETTVPSPLTIFLTSIETIVLCVLLICLLYCRALWNWTRSLDFWTTKCPVFSNHKWKLNLISRINLITLMWLLSLGSVCFLFWQCNCNYNIWSFLLNPYWYAFILSHNIWSLLAMLWCFYMTSYEKRGLFTSCFEGFF